LGSFTNGNYHFNSDIDIAVERIVYSEFLKFYLPCLKRSFCLLMLKYFFSVLNQKFKGILSKKGKQFMKKFLKNLLVNKPTLSFSHFFIKYIFKNEKNRPDC